MTAILVAKLETTASADSSTGLIKLCTPARVGPITSAKIRNKQNVTSN